MRSSLYWDDFERRIKETKEAFKVGKLPPVRRVAIFITNNCNFRCSYCNLKFGKLEMTESVFDSVVKKYGESAIIHITGGEPSVVKWLYPYIESHLGVKFHLNTNAFKKPPTNIRRLKVSLDSHNECYFDSLVQRKGAFKSVVKNIKEASINNTTSVTCVLSKENYKDAPQFMHFCKQEFPKLYAVFFSIYKGENPRFKFTPEDVDYFFKEVKFSLEKEMDNESLALFNETVDEKIRLIQGIRFPENDLNKPCYISYSERVVDWNGNEQYCSHLFRDKVNIECGQKHPNCKYGCNRRLVTFNQEVEKQEEVNINLKERQNVNP